MKPSEVYEVLKSVGAKHLHHANTVRTSCTFLEQGALLSRGYVESHSLDQTSQSSDEIDKTFGIWDCVFLDHVDIHHRGGRTKGPNQYGPVLFVLDLDVLLDLPAGSTVGVTKMNPVHWIVRQANEQRWYQNADELSQSLTFGDFDKMLVITTPEGKVEFPAKQLLIDLDDPQLNILSGTDAYVHAERRLEAAAQTGRVRALIGKHVCRDDCICVTKYSGYDARYVESRFM